MITPEDELNLASELQEMYIITKHWLLDIPFYLGELSFCRNLLQHTPDATVVDNWQTALKVRENVRMLESNIAMISRRIESHLLALGVFVTANKFEIEIGLIQDHAEIEETLEALQHAIESVKKSLTPFVEDHEKLLQKS